VSVNDPDCVRSLENKQCEEEEYSESSDDDLSSIDGIDFEELEALSDEQDQITAEDSINMQTVSSAVFEDTIDLFGDGKRTDSKIKLNGRRKRGIKGKEAEYRSNYRGCSSIISEDEIQSDELEMLQDYFEVRLSSPCVVSGNSELFNKD
jgi:hypothetical protein